MMRKLAFMLVILFILAMPGRAVAQELSSGVIEGQVVNQTEGGGSVAGLNVSLITLEEATEETRTTKADEEGRFRFADVSGERSYLVLVTYMEIAYYYPIDFNSGETLKSIEIPVCDTTASDQAIKVTLSHIIVRVEEEFFSVTEVFWLVNDGDQTCVGAAETSSGGTRGTLVFTLPQGASDFQVPEDSVEDYLIADNNKVINTLIFPPGEKQLVYSYKLARPKSADYTIHLKIDYPTDSLMVMVEGEDIEVASTRLTPADPITSETGQRFIHFGAENLNRDDIVDVRLSNPSGSSNVAFIILWVIVAAAILGVSGYLLKRKRRQPAPQAVKYHDGDTAAQKELLLKEMAQLDSDLGQGLLDEDTYRQMYSDKKTQLAKLNPAKSKESSNE